MADTQEFSILDPQGMNTVAFVIERDIVNKEEVFTIKMLDNKQISEDGKVKKTFFVESAQKDPMTVLMLTIGKSKVVMNSAVLENDELSIIKKPDSVKYEPIINTEGDYIERDFKYTPNLKRPIAIIDTETAEEVKPVLYIDSNTGDIVGKCKMVPYRAYIAVEVN